MMFWVECSGEYFGPLTIEGATSLCGFFNFMAPMSATVRNACGQLCQ
jgi:hypothetical protein